MEVLQRKDLSSIRVPMGGDKVYKDECVYSFDTPVSDSCVAPAVSLKFLALPTTYSQLHLFICLQVYYFNA